MKYKAIIETDDFEDFEFFEDGNGKYIHGIDASAENNEWIALYFTECEQEPKTGHCEDCKQFRKLPYHADTLGKCIHHAGFCPKGDWYCADYKPQESEDKE